jgi:hypothetical protein
MVLTEATDTCLVSAIDYVANELSSPASRLVPSVGSSTIKHAAMSTYRQHCDAAMLTEQSLNSITFRSNNGAAT